MKRFVALIMLMSMMFSSLAFAPSDRIEDRISDQEPTRFEEVAELPDSNDETGGIKYTDPINDPGCGCTTANAGTYTTNTNGGNVNIRSGHSTQTSVIGSIPRGTSFKVTAASSTWAHVTYNGISGYASMSVIKKVSSDSNTGCDCSPANAGTYTTNTVSGNVNIRSGHGTQYSVIGSIPRGTSFKVTAASGTWAHVTYNGINGYASMSVIKKVQSNSAPASSIDTDCVYMIKNVAKGTYLTAGTSTVQLSNKDAMDGRQLWYVAKSGNGYNISSMGHKDTASNGKYESLLRGCSANNNPGFINPYGSYIYWSISKTGSYYQISNSSYGTVLAAGASGDAITCIASSNTTNYAKWSLEKIQTSTFNNYWKGGYNDQDSKVYIKINIDNTGSDSVYLTGVIKKEHFDILKSANNPWNEKSSNVVIYGPNDTVPPNIKAFQVTYKGFQPDSTSVAGYTQPFDSNDNELGLNENWDKAYIYINTRRDAMLNLSGDICIKKTILHELGHALKLAHPKQREDLAWAANGRGGYADDFRVASVMNQKAPTQPGNLACCMPKWHDIINLKNKWK